MYAQIQHLEDYQLATTQQSRGRNRSGGNRRRRSSNNRNRGGGGAANGAPVLPELTEEEMKSQLGDLGAKTTDELRAMALEKNLKNGIPPRRTELILELLTHAAEENDLLLGAGILDVMNDGQHRHEVLWSGRWRRCGRRGVPAAPRLCPRSSGLRR